MSKDHESPYAVPAAIIVAGLMIAAALGSGNSAPSAVGAPAAALPAAGNGCGI